MKKICSRFIPTEFPLLSDMLKFRAANPTAEMFAIQHFKPLACKNPASFSYLAIDEPDIKHLLNQVPIEIKCCSNRRIKDREKNEYYTVNSKHFRSYNVFELIDKEYRKIYFDIDKFTMSFDEFNNVFMPKFNQIVKDAVKQYYTLIGAELDPNITDEYFNPLVFVRNETDEDGNNLEIVKSVHIIYHKLRLEKTQNKELSMIINGKIFTKSKAKVDSSVYSRNRNYCLPKMTKVKDWNKRTFVPLGEYTNEQSQDYRNYLINCPIGTTLIKYEPILTKLELQELKYIKCIEKNIVCNLIENLKPEFYLNHHGIWKDLTKYIINNGYDYYEWLKHSSKIFLGKESTDDDCDKYIETFEDCYVEPTKLFNVIKKIFNIHFDIFNDYNEEFLQWVITDNKVDRTKFLEAYESFANARKEFLNKSIKTRPQPIIIIKNNNQEILKIYLAQQIILNETIGAMNWFTHNKLVIQDKANEFKKCIKKPIEQIRNDIIDNSFAKYEIYKAFYGSGKTAFIVIERINIIYYTKYKSKFRNDK